MDSGRHRAQLRPDSNLTMRHLLARFLLGSLMALIVVTTTALYFSRRFGLQDAIADASKTVSVVGATFIQPQLTAGVIAADPAALDDFDARVRSVILGGDIVRVKLWDSTGKIVYSDEQRLVGQRFELGAEELGVLAGNRADAELSDLRMPENQYEAPSTKLLEVYAKVNGPNGQPLLFEVYFLYATVVKAGAQAWKDLLPISAISLLGLELTQLPLVFQLTRRLRRSQVQREHLLRQAVESSAVERRRIAADLHDGVVQDLSGVAYSLAAMARRESKEPNRPGALAESAENVRAAVQGLRSLLVEIHPPNLASEGLASAIADLTARLKSHGIRPVVTVDVPNDLDPSVGALLFRGVQEAMRNVISHSKAREVQITLNIQNGMAQLVVDDDGVGFNPALVNEPAVDGHVGLRLLADLTAEMGGTVVLESDTGVGTRFILRVPIT